MPLNDVLVASQVTRNANRSGRSGMPNTRLHGRVLILARGAWLTATGLIVTLFLIRLPTYYVQLQTVCTDAVCGDVQPTPDSTQTLQELGLSVAAYATIALVLEIALALLCFALGALMF
ncbi:MAG: hypothetical protein IMW89_06610 [Ktedonobacteraceae bacterium]|nr:hypothetical protein [Ktedonobacteraceae bacterium]